jgi:DNA-binding XRE family transcriptional regulator
MFKAMAAPKHISAAITTALELSAVRHLAENGGARKLRILGRLTQAEIGDTVGVSAVTVCTWERGIRRPTGQPAIAYGRLLAAIAEAHRGDDDQAS